MDKTHGNSNNENGIDDASSEDDDGGFTIDGMQRKRKNKFSTKMPVDEWTYAPS